MKWELEKRPEGHLERKVRFAWKPTVVWSNDNRDERALVWFEPYEVRRQWTRYGECGDWSYPAFYAMKREK